MSPTEFIVRPNDDGIRPAGPQDECFYCHRRVGQPHNLEECVVVLKTVVYGVYNETRIGSLTHDEPSYATREHCEFMRNDGSWCADNVWDTGTYEGEPIPDIGDNASCLSAHLEFRVESMGDVFFTARGDEVSLTPHERELWVNRAVADSLPMRLFSDGVFNGPRLRMETWLHEPSDCRAPPRRQ